LRRGPLRPGPETGMGRLVAERRAIHVEDLLDEPAYRNRDPLRVATAELMGARTTLWVPMEKDGGIIGTICVYRTEVRAFTDGQIRLLQTFADQAVIAIENARLFSELEQRNSELHESNRQVTEALEQQTATASILEVIASSPTDVQPVLDAIV